VKTLVRRSSPRKNVKREKTAVPFHEKKITQVTANGSFNENKSKNKIQIKKN
jgi:hypothetical protein